MSRLLLVLFYFILCTGLVHAQLGQNANYGTRSLSLGGISSTLDGSDALLNNFSNITNSSDFLAIVSSERRFELEDLTSIAFGLHLPVAKFGHLGFTISSYGLDEYQEQKFSLLYARKLSQKISVSLNFDYNNLRIEQFGSQGFISFGIGIAGDLGNGFNYGVYIFNPEKIEVAEANEVPGFLELGIQKEFSKSLILFGEISKVIDEEANLSIGFSYNPIEILSIRLGFNTTPGAFSFGISYKALTNLSIEGGSQYDPILGLTPGISLKYNRK